MIRVANLEGKYSCNKVSAINSSLKFKCVSSLYDLMWEIYMVLMKHNTLMCVQIPLSYVQILSFTKWTGVQLCKRYVWMKSITTRTPIWSENIRLLSKSDVLSYMLHKVVPVIISLSVDASLLHTYIASGTIKSFSIMTIKDNRLGSKNIMIVLVFRMNWHQLV